MTQETEIPADIALRANEVAVLIWDEAMSEPPDGLGVHVDQKMVESFVANAIRAERERCAKVAEAAEWRTPQAPDDMRPQTAVIMGAVERTKVIASAIRSGS